MSGNKAMEWLHSLFPQKVKCKIDIVNDMKTPSSPRSRMIKYREKIRKSAEKREEVLQKDRKRKQESRSKEKAQGISAEVKAHRDKLNRVRVSKCRARKKLNLSTEELQTPYKSKRSLGKAVSRAAKSLPCSPRKKKVVVRKLAEKEGLIKSTVRAKHLINEETIKKVEDFYCRDDISRQAPGKKDYVTVWQKQDKVKLQKRHMYYSVKETHSLFKLENPQLKIGKSKFAQLKPVNVLHKSETPKDACLCMYHENINLLCEAVHKALPTFPIYSSDFVSNFVCSADSEKCMTGNCDKCSGKILTWFDAFDGVELNQEIIWYEWAREEGQNEPMHKRRRTYQPPEKQQTKKRLKKCCRSGTVIAAFESLMEKLPDFLLHVFIKRQQSDYFQTKLVSISRESSVIQVDFSENYTLQHQGEVQSAYWNQNQLTIFTVCVWMEKEKKSLVFVSDDLDHDKTSVCVFMDKVLSKLTTENGIKKADIFSDGPSSQFKNQYIFSYLPSLYKRYQLDSLNWNFFATSHGKGAVDGIGGTVKRNVWLETLSRQAVVNTLEDFSNVAMTKEQKIDVIPVSAKVIEASASEMELDNAFASSKPVKSIKKMHFVSVLANGSIKCKEFSSKVDISEESKPDDEVSETREETDESELEEWYEDACKKHAPPATVDITEGDFVICQYEGELFPGQVTKVYSEGARVKAFQKCAGGWRWPRKPDEIDYLPQDIIQKIPHPEPINNRGTFKIEALQSRWEC